MIKDIGRVRAIYRFPVKSMAGQVLESATVGWHGLDGDRRFAFLRAGDRSGFPWLTASKLPKLLGYIPLTLNSDQDAGLPTHVRTPAGLELDLRGEALRREVSDAFGSEVEIIRLDQGIFDEAKVSLISVSTINAIEQETGRTLDAARFRPNILVDSADESAFAEDEWAGKIVWIGEGPERVALNVYMKDRRCVMINLDPATGVSDSMALKAVARMNNSNAGVYATVIRTGVISVGDKLYLEEM